MHECGGVRWRQGYRAGDKRQVRQVFGGGGGQMVDSAQAGPPTAASPPHDIAYTTAVRPTGKWYKFTIKKTTCKKSCTIPKRVKSLLYHYFSFV